MDGGASGFDGSVGMNTCTTSVSGTAFAPNGTLPLYNVIVYVPRVAPDPIPSGATCDKCGSLASGMPIVTTLSDATGHFKLDGVPAGENVPLVLQVGKWRRQVVIPKVTECKDTALSDPEQTRLPRSHAEGEMPKIAVTTGGCDPIACILPKIGVAASEFGVDGSTKVTIFKGGGGNGPVGETDAQTLWSDANALKAFDMVILACECNENLVNKPPAAQEAMFEYLNGGGRVFGTDYQYTWFRSGPAPFPTTADWKGNQNGPTGVDPFLVDTSFPKGKALADWLQATSSSSTYGQIPLEPVFFNVGRVNKAVSQSWVSSSNADKVLTFNAPVGAPPDQQCGKAVFLDAHVGAGSAVTPDFPGRDFDPSKTAAGCASGLSPQEKAFVFFLFDLSSCIQKDDGPVNPPVPK